MKLLPTCGKGFRVTSFILAIFTVLYLSIGIYQQVAPPVGLNNCTIYAENAQREYQACENIRQSKLDECMARPAYLVYAPAVGLWILYCLLGCYFSLLFVRTIGWLLNMKKTQR